jgi:hypothetical protein
MMALSANEPMLLVLMGFTPATSLQAHGRGVRVQLRVVGAGGGGCCCSAWLATHGWRSARVVPLVPGFAIHWLSMTSHARWHAALTSHARVGSGRFPPGAHAPQEGSIHTPVGAAPLEQPLHQRLVPHAAVVLQVALAPGVDLRGRARGRGRGLLHVGEDRGRGV